MVTLKPATEADAQALTELSRTTFDEAFAKDNRREDMDSYMDQTFSREMQLQEIRDPNRVIEIAWIDGAPAGFLHLRKGAPDPAVKGPKPIEILRLYVLAKWYGQGAGAALMERCLEIAREQGFKTVWLGVWDRNPRAQAFYKKYGFEFVGEHNFRLGSEDQIDLVMARSI